MTEIINAITEISLLFALWVSFVTTIISAWLMVAARIYGNNPIDIERNKRIIESYARVCIVSTIAMVLLVIIISLTKGILPNNTPL